MNRRRIVVIVALAIVVAAGAAVWLRSAQRPPADTMGCRIALEQSLASQLSGGNAPDNSKRACAGVDETVKARLVAEVAQEAFNRGPFDVPTPSN